MAYKLFPLSIIPFIINGQPLDGGKVYTYVAESSTPQTTYTDSTGGTPNTNPVLLNTYGLKPIWLDTSTNYKLVIKSSDDSVTYLTLDQVEGMGFQATQTPIITTIYDSNNNEVMTFSGIAGAVNYISIQNSATGNSVILKAQGDDTNCTLLLTAKGASGAVQIDKALTASAGTTTTTLAATAIAASSLTTTGNVAATGTVTATAGLTAGTITGSGGALAVTGNTSITGTLGVSGTSTTAAIAATTLTTSSTITSTGLVTANAGVTTTTVTASGAGTFTGTITGGALVNNGHRTGGVLTAGNFGGADQNNYPVGSYETFIMSTTSGCNLTGIVPQGTGQILHLVNSSSFTITLKHNSGGSSAGNKFSFYTGADIALTTHKSLDIFYDGSNWKDLSYL